MAIDRALRDEQLGRDLLIAEPFSEQPSHVCFARAERSCVGTIGFGESGAAWFAESERDRRLTHQAFSIFELHSEPGRAQCLPSGQPEGPARPF